MTKTTKIKSKQTEFSDSDIQKLAHLGTKEAIDKIEAYIKTQRDEEKKALAEMALEECEFFYYQPSSEKEEKEFLLCFLINNHERKIFKSEMEIGRIESKLEKFSLEKAVHEKVLTKHKNKINDWQYHYMDDFVICDHDQLKYLKDDLVYEKAWVEAAKKMISVSRYKKGIPDRHLSHFDFGFEDDEFRNDNCGCCDDDCSSWRNDEIIREDLTNNCPF